MRRIQQKHLYLTLVSLLWTSFSPAAGVQIRLAGYGSTQCSGRVEILSGSTWGTVCDDNWDLKDAEVVCRQLNCGTALSAPGSSHFGEGTGPILLDDVACSGSERSLTECQSPELGKHNCGHSEDAGVVCSGAPLRLAGSTQCSGRVEILSGSTWGTVCDDNWDLKDAEVVCRQLNCGTALSAPESAHFGEGTGPILLDDVACSGSERSLTECQSPELGKHNCGHSEDAGVVCSGAPLRLAGSTQCSGRVEILSGSTWGTVCDDNWDLKDAEVVCRQLNCGTALSAPGSAHFGEGTGPILLDDVACSGSELSLTECQSPELGKHNCGHSEDAGVVCSVSLPKPSISMKPVGEVTWGQDIVIICSTTAELLGGTFTLHKIPGSSTMTQTPSSNSATFNIIKVEFGNEGSYQCQYEINISSKTFRSTQSDNVTLSITVRLQQPSISLTSPNRGLVWSPEGAEVTRGYSFVFTCSINCSYSEGQFFLISSGSNTTATQQTVNNSASFHFPVAEYKHQGNYSCVYEVELSTQKFNSTETGPIIVIVKLSMLPMVSSVAAAGCLPLLVLLLVVCLVCRRRQQAKQQTLVHNKLPVRVENTYNDDVDDYVNMDEMETKDNGERFDDHDSEESGLISLLKKVKEVCLSADENGQDEEETSSEEEDDYENVEPLTEANGQESEETSEEEDDYENAEPLTEANGQESEETSEEEDDYDNAEPLTEANGQESEETNEEEDDYENV